MAPAHRCTLLLGAATGVLRSPSLWLGVVGLLVLLLVGFGAIAWVRRWSVGSGAGPVAPGGDLEHYRRLRDAGELSEQEYEQITRLLAPPARDEGQGAKGTESGSDQ